MSIKSCIRTAAISFVFIFFIKDLNASDSTRWMLDKGGIKWDVINDKRLPHKDNIEMSGQLISGIITYGVDAARKAVVSREIFWPMLRTLPDGPDYMKYRAYLKRTFGDEVTPEITINGKKMSAGKVTAVSLNGFLSLTATTEEGLTIKRTLFPSVDKPVFYEKWEVFNPSGEATQMKVARMYQAQREKGAFGEYLIEASVNELNVRLLKGVKPVSFTILFTARNSSVQPAAINSTSEQGRRNRFIQQVSRNLILSTPDPVLNQAFAFAKIRTAESLFKTKMGLVHSPGGGRYYGGVWANDQVEYAGPFFPFLGYAPANEASLNAYRKFATVMRPDYKKIWASFEMEGDLPCCSKDRGDAAMYAYGASLYALALGDKKAATELWPAIEWCLEYNQRKKNKAGVIESQTDEMEGRLPTGTANLSTSSLAYGALMSAVDLARSLNKPDSIIGKYTKQASDLRTAIEDYFGAEIKGLHTYKYYKEHTSFRSWICLPLVMGIMDRKEGTVKALFDELWTADGLATEAGEKQFWDRSTLYGLRGVFKAGETVQALDYLKKYTRRRLLGEHVPYPVEAYPEGNQAHLAAESALYCRIFTEGLFGITPTGLNSFTALPRLPAGWKQMTLQNIAAFGTNFNIHVSRKGSEIEIILSQDGKIISRQQGAEGIAYKFVLPSNAAVPARLR